MILDKRKQLETHQDIEIELLQCAPNILTISPVISYWVTS